MVRPVPGQSKGPFRRLVISAGDPSRVGPCLPRLPEQRTRNAWVENPPHYSDHPKTVGSLCEVPVSVPCLRWRRHALMDTGKTWLRERSHGTRRPLPTRLARSAYYRGMRRRCTIARLSAIARIVNCRTGVRRLRTDKEASVLVVSTCLAWAGADPCESGRAAGMTQDGWQEGPNRRHCRPAAWGKQIHRPREK
jgi:hypothetical protein